MSFLEPTEKHLEEIPMLLNVIREESVSLKEGLFVHGPETTCCQETHKLCLGEFVEIWHLSIQGQHYSPFNNDTTQYTKI